jgi:prepilin-type N-terminal cleavage/methylation domain-containing protein
MDGTNQPKASSAGFSLIEVMICLALIAIEFLSISGFIIAASRLSDENKLLNLAVSDAQAVIELIQATPFDQIMDPAYPSAALSKPSFPSATALSSYHGLHLPKEEVRVYYMDSSGNYLASSGSIAQPFVTPDPLTVEVRVEYQNSRNEIQTYKMQTIRTR